MCNETRSTQTRVFVLAASDIYAVRITSLREKIMLTKEVTKESVVVVIVVVIINMQCISFAIV